MELRPIVDGIVFQWEKPLPAGKKFASLSEALISQIGIADQELFFSPTPEQDPFYPYVASIAKEFFSFPPGRILISADYDVDGTTSGTILGRAFRALGFDVRVFIPDRFIDGYGISYARMEEIQTEWPYTHFVATDCGATELQGLAKFGAAFKTTVAVVDHHKRGPLPPGGGLLEVNPHMCIDQGVQENGYSAGIMAAMLIHAARQYFPQLEAINAGCEILAGLSAMADSASMLSPAARYYAKTFLAKAHTPEAGVGIKALMEAAGLEENPTSTDVAFKISPVINVAGRLRRADAILALLQEDDPNRAHDMVEKLHVLNKTRMSIQQEIQRQAMDQYKDGDPVLIACHKDWNCGVVGPAAGQIAELLGIPVFLGGYIPQKKSYSFSGRTGSDTDIHALLSECVKDLPVQFGGHKVALGMKIAGDDIDCVTKLRENLCAAAPQKKKFTRSITKVLHGQSVSFHNTQELKKLEPYGVENPTPIFCIPNVKLEMGPLAGLPNSLSGTAISDDGRTLPVIIFRNALLAGTKRFSGHMVGEIILSKYANAVEVKFLIKDLIPVA